jgi:hypothetical protein
MLLLFDIVKGGSNGPPTLVTAALVNGNSSTYLLILALGLTDYAD